LEKAYILVSNESANFKEQLRDVLGDGECISFVPKQGGVDFNDYEGIHKELLEVLREIKRDGYKDEDISVFISAGTSAVTLALTMFAVKEGRQVEYIKQSNKPEERDIVAINISFEDVYSFSPEERN